MFKDVSELKDKKILVVGLGKTGVSLAHFLTEHGAQVTVTDHKSKPELSAQLEMLGELPIKFELGGHSPKTFVQQDLVILSPGIPTHLKIFDYARSQGIKITGEVEFSSQFVKEPMVAITGTNGKTTVQKLISEMLVHAGQEVWSGGANGQPLSEYLRSGKKAKLVILELSSYMLETAETLSPGNIVFMNLAENHLDRYRSMEDYVNAKRRIFRNTNQGTTSILNADDNAVVELARDPAVQRGRIFYFSRKPALEPQIMNIGGAVNIGKEIKVRTGPEIETFRVDLIKMLGKHSIENLMAAMLVAREHGATHESIQRTIDTGVFAEMKELGELAAAMHLETGKYVAQGKLDSIWFYGPHHLEFADGLRAAGFAGELQTSAEFREDIAQSLAGSLRDGDIALVKGSRGMELERFVHLTRPLNFSEKD